MTVSIVLSLPVVLALIAAVVIVVLAVLFKTGDLRNLRHVTALVREMVGGRGDRKIDVR